MVLPGQPKRPQAPLHRAGGDKAKQDQTGKATRPNKTTTHLTGKGGYHGVGGGGCGSPASYMYATPPPAKAHGIPDFRITVQNIGIYSLYLFLSQSQSLVATSQLDEGTNCCFWFFLCRYRFESTLFQCFNIVMIHALLVYLVSLHLVCCGFITPSTTYMHSNA